VTATVVRRLLQLPVILLGVSFLVFLLTRAIPGDPVDAIVGDKAAKSVKDRVRAERGFDRPLLVQYRIYLGRLSTGDLGESYKRSGDKVSDEIKRRLPPTIELTLAAMAIALVAGLGLGVLSAVRRGTWIDSAATTVALAGVSVPIFWLALLLILAFGSLLPIGGNLNVEYFLEPKTGFVLLDTLLQKEWAMFWDALKHLVLPAAALATIPMAMTARITRTAMIEALGGDYVRTARAKGLRPWAVVMRHALRNAAIPIVTLVGLEFGYLLGGAVLTETMFSWPGMGTYLLQSVEGREYDAIMGAVLILATVFVLVNLVVDVLYVFIDPRVKYG